MIPKRLHAIWVGPPMPEVYVGYLETWQDLHPEWSYYLWTDSGGLADVLPSWQLGLIEDMENRDLYDRAEEIVPAHSVGQFRSDVARYSILNKLGGVYVDVDLEPRRPIDPLLSDHSFRQDGPWCSSESPPPITAFAVWENERWVSNAFMGSVAGDPYTQALITELPARVARFRHNPASVVSGPRFVTRIARRERVHLFEPSVAFPYAFDELDRSDDEFPDAYMVHHWNHQRELKERPIHVRETPPD